MSFRPEDLHDFDTAREVRIETHTDGDRIRSTVIWIVVDRGEVFVRSVRGIGGRWYQDALDNPAVTIADGGRRLEARAVPVHDAESNRRMTDHLNTKYAGADGLAEMLTPAALEATFRLDPRSDQEQPLEAPAFLGSDEPSELGPAVDVSLLDGGQPVEESVLLQPHKSV